MPLFLEICIAIITIAISTAAIFAGVGYYKQGGKQQSLDNDSIYKNRIEALELKANTQTTDIEKLTKEVKDLHEAIDLRDKKFAEAILILQGKDPVMGEFIKKVNEYIELAKPTITKMDKFLDGQILS